MSVQSNNNAAQSYKIIIAGPVGSGKTQATNVLSDKETVSTEARTSRGAAGDKQTITVAMDYGITVLDSGEKVHIYGTPGHDRFDFMWEILSENAAGLIVLVNAKDVDPVADMQTYLDSFMPLVKNGALIIGVTHAENIASDLQQRLVEQLMTMNVAAEVVTVDARERVQTRQMVHTLIRKISAQTQQV